MPFIQCLVLQALFGSLAWHRYSWPCEAVFLGPPDNTPSSLGFSLDFLLSNSVSNPSTIWWILSPNKALFHSLFPCFAFCQLRLSHQLSPPGLLQQPPNNLPVSVFCPYCHSPYVWVLACGGSWLMSHQGLPDLLLPWLHTVLLQHASQRHRCLLFPRPHSFLPGDFLWMCSSPSLQTSWLLATPFMEISAQRGPLTIAYCPVWFSLWPLSFIHCRFLSSVVQGACHCLEGCLAHNRWILNKHVFEF